MSKEDKLKQVTDVVAGKIAALYDGNHPKQAAIFEALMKEKAKERGESPEHTASLLASLLSLGAALNNCGIISQGDDRGGHTPIPVAAKDTGRGL
jgi:hypothetical protein